MQDSTTLQDIDAALSSGYLIVREMPHGVGFSSFAARSKHDGSAVEIKTVPLEVFSPASPVTEAELARRRVAHPNINPIVASGARGGTFYWISPAIEARTLRERLSRGGRIAREDSLTILRDVSAGLTHAHMHGVVHGGLSPDSVLLSGGTALIADVGIPEVFGGLGRADAIRNVTTPTGGEALRYASPEQAGGVKANTRSDVYSWGVIAYEILAGRHPFSARLTPREVMAAHKGEEPPALASGSTAPAGVTRLVMRCLSKNPSKRPETGREILDVMTKEILAPLPAPAAGKGQKAVMLLFALALAVIGAIVWLGIRP